MIPMPQVPKTTLAKSRPIRRPAILAPLAAAVICTALIVLAIFIIARARANGDAMVMICPVLGAIFLSIPACQAWAAVLQRLRRR